MAHQIEDVEIEEEVYDENADEDFNPEEAGADEHASSSEEDEKDTKQAATKKAGRKRKSEALDNDLDSGDEATINERQSKKRQRKGAAKGASHSTPGGEHDEDSAGEGGLIKTRAQRLAEKVERKHRRRAREGEVTIDVDSVWAELAALPIGRQTGYVGVGNIDDGEEGMDIDGEGNKENIKAQKLPPSDNDDLITIKRRIEYAGEVTEVEERVPRNSKEAKRYLADHPEADHSSTNAEDTPIQLHRPLKRPSLFEPNPHSIVKGVPSDRLRPRAPSRVDVLTAEKRAAEAMEKKAQHMTTVEKSALDWRGFVAGQKGLQEELDEYGKSKSGYLAREDFLGRVEFMRDVQAKAARLKG